MKRENEKKNVSLYLFLSYFAYCYERYRQLRKIPRLHSAQINFNNWILCTTKSYQLPPRNGATWFSASLPPPRKKILASRQLFQFQLPPESQEAAFYGFYFFFDKLIPLLHIMFYKRFYFIHAHTQNKLPL